jgi:hypothetical protein
MTKIAKFLTLGAVAALAVAFAAPSEAAKKKRMRAPAPVAACTAPNLCSFDCVGTGCKVNFCAPDGKWYWSMVTPYCLTGFCPQACGPAPKMSKRRG